MLHPDGQDPDITFKANGAVDTNGPLSPCFKQFEFCQLPPSMYNLTSDGSRYWCSECIDGYAWDEDLEKCDTCGNVFTNCLECSENECTKCNTNFELGDDGECWAKFPNCVKHTWADDLRNGSLICEECNPGLFFIAYAKDVTNVIPSPKCIECDDQAWGIEYCMTC